MPLPLIPIAIAAIATAIGGKKMIDAHSDKKEAKRINEEANDIVSKAIHNQKSAKGSSKSALDRLGRTKLRILQNEVNQFVRIFSQIKNVDFRNNVSIDHLNMFILDKQNLIELKHDSNFAVELGGMGAGTVGGAITAFGAYSAAGAFATASTGTAIASLSGAAATNATLAFFGGGSLAAGGLGVAGGTAVLGGLVAGPAFAIMGVIISAKAEKAKDEARINLAEAKKISSELRVATKLCNDIVKKATMFNSLLEQLNSYFITSLENLDRVVTSCGTDYNNYTEEQKNIVAASACLVKAIKTVLDTPILNEDGSITAESDQVLNRINPEQFQILIK